jgi:Holliday junction resolvasome RuvABC endonuclease subunit
MKLLALDIASVVGCCDGEVGGTPRLWTWDLRDVGPTRGERFMALHRLLQQYFNEADCDGVVYETPMGLAAMVERGATADTIIMLVGAIGVVELVCAERGKKVESLAVQSARASVLGWGRNTDKRQKTKDRVFNDVTKLFSVPAANHNEADAWVLWSYACARLNPRVAATMTPLFRSAQ